VLGDHLPRFFENTAAAFVNGWARIDEAIVPIGFDHVSFSLTHDVSAPQMRHAKVVGHLLMANIIARLALREPYQSARKEPARTALPTGEKCAKKYPAMQISSFADPSPA
jgi:hypothetical protein